MACQPAALKHVSTARGLLGCGGGGLPAEKIARSYSAALASCAAVSKVTSSSSSTWGEGGSRGSAGPTDSAAGAESASGQTDGAAGKGSPALTEPSSFMETPGAPAERMPVSTTRSIGPPTRTRCSTSSRRTSRSFRPPSSAARSTKASRRNRGANRRTAVSPFCFRWYRKKLAPAAAPNAKIKSAAMTRPAEPMRSPLL